MAKPAVNANELTPELRKKLGIQARKPAFPKEEVRRYALVVLAEIKDLTKDQRAAVLRHATKVNEV